VNKLEKTSLAAGLFFGATGVILGAVGSHALKGHSTEALEFFQIGNRYQIYHALFLLILGLLQSKLGYLQYNSGYRVVFRFLIFVHTCKNHGRYDHATRRPVLDLSMDFVIDTCIITI
jgi:uncharacterized membrane protein YgdD (TMEM256/DUF423 family)